MLAYLNDLEEYIATGRALPVRSKPPRGGYSPRYDRRRRKPGKLTNGIQGRCNKRRTS